MRMVILAVIALCSIPWGAWAQQQKLVRILVSTPQVSEQAYRAVGDVFAGCIIRELNRKGGLEIVDRAKSEEYLRKKKLNEGIDNRVIATEVGSVLGADIVIYSTLDRSSRNFVYSIAFFEVDRDVIQRIVNGSFSETASPEEIGRLVRDEMRRIVTYIPSPSELNNFGAVIRENTINPDEMPKSSNIDLPKADQFGALEQVLSYYRVFPGELEYMKLEQQQEITRIQMDADSDIDANLIKTFTKMQMFGEFALRYNMQSYLIKNCSLQALNVFLANKVPVFFTDDGSNIGLLIGYSQYKSNGTSIFRTNYFDEFDSTYLIHRKLIAILVILPKPGKKGGISQDYLETAISRYHNDWGKTPSLVEIKEGFLDIISSGMEN